MQWYLMSYAQVRCKYIIIIKQNTTVLLWSIEDNEWNFAVNEQNYMGNVPISVINRISFKND